MDLLKFKSFLLEDRVEFLKKQHPAIDTSHDALAKHRDAGNIIDHFAAHADPTKKKVYTQWVVNQYKKGHIRQEDHPRINKALSSFEQHKANLPSKDINQYHHITDLEGALPKDKPAPTSKRAEVKQVKAEGADLIHSENGVTVHHIKTEAAAKYYGKGTQWCTAGDDNNMFHEYHKEGPLHVVHTPDKRKYQFHFKSRQFMDEQDTPVHLPTMVKKYPELKNVTQFRNPRVSKFNPHSTDEHEKLHFMEPHERAPFLKHAVNGQSASDHHTREFLAQFPEHAGNYVKDGVTSVRSEVARHPEHAGKMVKDSDPEVRAIVAQHPEHAGHLVKDSQPYVRRAVAFHKEHAGKLVNDPDKSVRFQVAQHPEHAGHLVNDPVKEIRGVVATHKEHAGHLVNDPEMHVRLAVAQHSEHAGKMMNDSNEHLRATIAINHPEHAVNMTGDRSYAVRAAAARHPEAAGKLLKDHDSDVRSVVAQHREHAEHLMKDSSSEVRANVATHHPDLAGHLINDESYHVRRAVARHAEHAVHMINDPDHTVRGTVAEHPHLEHHFINDIHPTVQRGVNIARRDREAGFHY
jgi:hypothetical protein